MDGAKRAFLQAASFHCLMGRSGNTVTSSGRSQRKGVLSWKKGGRTDTSHGMVCGCKEKTLHEMWKEVVNR